MARKDYTDNLGRTWTWNEEKAKYDYVAKNPKPTTVKEFEKLISDTKKEHKEIVKQLESGKEIESRMLVQAHRRRLESKIAKLEEGLKKLQKNAKRRAAKKTA